ncbi:GAF and ANTAR domain-containing protein [Pseudonocardia nematodicida]|uniref:GAF and ANTAR domain-containing protein n=1 Tax=Pseudonocardia nematodicida TaxID=1206997 RepID=A0ABV1KGE6_9PSEU
MDQSAPGHDDGDTRPVHPGPAPESPGSGDSPSDAQRDDLLVQELTQLTAALVDCDTVEEVLKRVVDAVGRVVPAAGLVSVTLRDDSGEFHTPVETDSLATAFDQVQYRSGRGPCVDAAQPDGPAAAWSDDLRGETQWPEFAEEVAARGYRSVLAVELLPDAHPPRLPGALNVYATGSAVFGPADRDRLTLLAGYASLALAKCSAVSAAALREAQLREAIESRDVIGQAKGILMARRGLSADEAFDVLRRTSQDVNVKLAHLARTVVESPDRVR